MSKAKQAAGEKALDWVEDGMTIGLGTGSTVYYFVEALGKKVAEGMNVRGVPTSIRTEEQAKRLNIPVLPVELAGTLDVVVDGADEFDPHFQLIKGGGGALFREKVVALQGKQFVIIADESKGSEVLGSFPLPVEIVPFGAGITELEVEKLGGLPSLRRNEDGSVYQTDNGNYILDCNFGYIKQPADLHAKLKALTGVVETGLFIDMATHIVIGYADGRTEVKTRS